MEQGSRKMQYLVTFAVSTALVALGTSSAWPAPVLAKFKRNETDVEITDHGIAWMLSMNPIGFIVGSFITRFTSDHFGRRATILASVIPNAIGSIIAATASNVSLLCVTVLMWSCGTGMVSTVVGIYLAEIADKDIRGTLSLCTKFMFNLGNLLVMAIGPFLSYKTLNYTLLPLPFCYFAACSWIPETPYYSLKKGRVDDARKALAMLRDYKNQQMLEDELESMRLSVKKEMVNSSSAKELFTGKLYRKAIIISAGLKLTQILTGTVLLKQYLGVIMQESKLHKDYEPTVFLVFGGITFVVGIMSSILVDRVGRRPLFIYSYLGTGVFLFIDGIYFFLMDVIKLNHDSLSSYGFVPFIGIILTTVISTVGYNSLVVVVPSEIFPINVKSIAMTSLNIFGGVLGFTLAKTYQYIKDFSGLYGVFWIFSTFAFVGTVFSYFFVLETKGKDLNEIQKELQGDVGRVELNHVASTGVSGEAEITELEILHPKATNHL